MTITNIVAKIFCPLLCYYIGHVSLAFSIYCAITLIFSTIYHIWKTRLLPKPIDMGSDVVNRLKGIDKFIKFQIRHFIIGMFLSAIFFAWIIFEVAKFDDRAMFVGVVIGGASGLVVGCTIFCSVLREAKSIRQSIEDIEQMSKG